MYYNPSTTDCLFVILCLPYDFLASTSLQPDLTELSEIWTSTWFWFWNFCKHISASTVLTLHSKVQNNFPSVFSYSIFTKELARMLYPILPDREATRLFLKHGSRSVNAWTNKLCLYSWKTNMENPLLHKCLHYTVQLPHLNVIKLTEGAAPVQLWKPVQPFPRYMQDEWNNFESSLPRPSPSTACSSSCFAQGSLD